MKLNKEIRNGDDFVMILNLILGAAIALGVNSNEVTEIHKIYEIENGYVHGELIDGTGEGIYYSLEELKKEGVDNVNVGDIIEFKWTKNNFENENWEEFDAKEVD